MDLAGLSIRRPVLTLVLSLLITLFGVIGFVGLGVREYPAVDPPTLSISTNYPGAAAEVVEAQITAPIEEAVNSVAGIRTLMATSREGTSQITAEFTLDTDLDTVFTGCDVHERPEWMYRRDGSADDRVLPFSGRLVQGDAGISQTLPKLFIPNGAVWATRRSVLMEQGLITGPRAGIVVMSRERSVDIDEPVDFITAEAIAGELLKVRV